MPSSQAQIAKRELVTLLLALASKEKQLVLGKIAYRARIIRVLKSVKAQKTATNIAAGFRKICLECVKKKGAATSG